MFFLRSKKYIENSAHSLTMSFILKHMKYTVFIFGTYEV